MAMRSFLHGKRERKKLNGHFVTVIVPDKKLSYEEGVKRIEELLGRIKK